MLSDDERMQSYLEFKKRKVEMQREYRAKLKSTQLTAKRKYIRRKAQLNALSSNSVRKVPVTRPERSISEQQHNRKSTLEENRFLRDLDGEEDSNSNGSPSVSHPEYAVQEVCEEVPLEEFQSQTEEDDTEITQMMRRLEERPENCDDYIVVEDQCYEYESNQPEEETVEEEIAAPVEEIQQQLTEEEEQEAFYNQRDRILRLMDRLPKIDRLHYLAEVEAMLQSNVNKK